MYLRYYVYAYLRNSDLTPYYIGKGSKRRAWDKRHSVAVPKDHTKIVILESNLSEIGALALERRMIRWYGRKDLGTGILRNQTDGGDGSGWSQQAKEKISKLNKGRTAHNKGKTIPREICDSVRTKKEKIRPGTGANVGKKLSAETRAKMSAARKGKPLSAETKAKMSEARLKLFVAVHNSSTC